MRQRLVVIGDALLDVDMVGEARRLCPDAPVPVLEDVVEHFRPGGAGLAATMAALDGHDVTLVTPLGDDEAGERLESLLEGVEVLRIPYQGETPVKRRVRSGGQSLVRLDTGSTVGSFGDVPSALREVLDGATAVLVADYGRGTAALGAVRDALCALPPKLPLVWDPHLRGADPVAGSRLVTPNRSEAAGWARRGAADPRPPLRGIAAAGADAARLVGLWEAQAVAVTMGDRGALLSYGEGAPVVSPAPQIHCVDPCGAGDRFAVSAAVALGSGRITTEAVQRAVDAASAYVSAGGPSGLGADAQGADGLSAGGAGRRPVEATTAHDLAAQISARGGVVVATGGCFDLLHAGHVATLRAARRLGDCLVVCVNSDDSVRRLKGPTRPLVPATDRVRVLEALEFVDAVVVFDEDTPERVLEDLRPHVWAKGGDYAGCDVPEAAVLERWGGQAVVLPYLDGRSTTELVRTAADLRRTHDRLNPR